MITKKLTIEHPEAEINLVIKKPNSPVDDYKVKQILEDALLDILRHINKAKQKKKPGGLDLWVLIPTFRSEVGKPKRHGAVEGD